MDNYRMLVTPDGWMHAVSLSRLATPAMVLVLEIPVLHYMFITPEPDLTLDIQGWLGLQKRWSTYWLSKIIHVFGILMLDRSNASEKTFIQLLMKLWKPRNELSCSLSKVWLGYTLSSYIMLWNMLKARLGSVLNILLITSCAISPRPVLSLTSYIVVAISSSSLPFSSIW